MGANTAVREFALTGTSPLSDEEIVSRVRAGDTALYEVLMRRYNQRLFRVARSILRDDDEAEDVMQDAYVRAYTSLHQFEGRAQFSTWLTKIAIHEASSRLRKWKRLQALPGSPLRIPSSRRSDSKPLLFWNKRSTRCRTCIVAFSYAVKSST
jgi:RNA polymerase sigma-70 factor (ECF subfamily)